MTAEWDLPLSGDSVRLTRNELLLLDYVFCTASMLAQEEVEGLLDYHPLRMEIWQKVDIIDREESPQHGMLCTFGADTIALFLALIPTTFMYGNEDAGFSLKMKLAQRLSNTYVDPQIEQDKADIEAAAIKL